MAIPKRSLAEATNNISTTYSDMYSDYLTDQNAWTNFGTFQVIFFSTVHITFFSPENLINYFIFFLKGGVNHAIIVSNNTTNFEDLFDNDEDDDKDEERLIGL